MAASSSRGRSSSPFHHRKPSIPYSSTLSTSSLMNGKLLPKSSSSSSTSSYGSGNGGGYNSRSMTPSQTGSNSAYSKCSGNRTPVNYRSAEELIDGDKIVQSEYNPATAYAFDRVLGENTITPEVYEVAARPVIKAAMEGVNAYLLTPASSSSEETHNTLKFASRAKCVEINASRNKIIDEKSLTKKYQKEITCLRRT